MRITAHYIILTLTMAAIIVITMPCRAVGVLPVSPDVQYEDTVSFEKAKARNLKEVIIKPKHKKYSKKNNPAVELMEKVRHSRKDHDPAKEDYYSYDKYQKMLLGLNDFNSDLVKNQGKLGKQFNFFGNYVDTAHWTGKQVLNLFLKEKSSKVYSGKEFGKEVEVVEGLSSNGLDDAFNKENMRNVLEDVFREINLYNNDIVLMQTRFVSPLSFIGPDYYKYEITDTVLVGGEPCVELTFFPRTPEAYSFNGKMFVPANDSIKYVKRITMRIPKSLNLNYVDNIFVSQNFERDSLGNAHKTLDDMSLEMQFIPGTPKFYVSRQVVYDNFAYELPQDYLALAKKGNREIVDDNAEKRNAEYWADKRLIPLSHAETKMTTMMTTLRRQPFLYWTEKVIKTFIGGYITTGNPSKFNFGPLNTTVSYNTAEGVRFRLGGMTTTALSPHWFANGYVAYGLRDHKVKYMGEVEYSIYKKKYTPREFPLNSIKAFYQYDIDQLGQHYVFTNADNMFISFKRKKSDLITYRRLAQIDYNLELRNQLSFNFQFRHETQEATKWVPFITGDGRHVPRFHQSVFKAVIRYAPGEKVIATSDNRMGINWDAPVLMLSHEYGPKGLFGSDFTINKTEFSAKKRFWFSSFGFTEILLKGGILWSQVPFPALPWQNANLSYTIQPESFTLMNPMEFAMDKYASIDLTYYMNGLIFNRIPWFKKLKLRELFTFKGLVGDLSRKNNPEYNPELYRFPLDAETRPMGKTPYMEIGCGIDNIFTILRVDYVWRLTYKNLPGVDKSGLRISLHFSF